MNLDLKDLASKSSMPAKPQNRSVPKFIIWVVNSTTEPDKDLLTRLE